MRLRDLEPWFVTFGERSREGSLVRVETYVATLAEAQGIFFCCPTCYVTNGNTVVGTHGICVAFADRGVPDHLGSHNKAGQPSRWQVSGTGYDDLTLSPSIDSGDWHGFITGGQIT